MTAISDSKESKRDVGDVVYEVLKKLPNDKFPPPGGTFSAWAWGSIIQSAYSSGPITTKQLEEWIADGSIVRKTPTRRISNV